MANNDASQSDEQEVTVIYKDEVTQKKIHEHLNNEDDIITEQDIANINTGITEEEHELIVLTDLQEVPAKDSLEIEEVEEEIEEEIEEKKVKDNRDSDVGTSWNVLGS